MTAAAMTLGLIAEEVGAVMPEVVTFEDNGIDARGVDYQRLVAVLIEAMKEQQKDISAMQAENATLLNEHEKVEELEATVAQLKATAAQQQKEFTTRLKEQDSKDPERERSG